MLGRCFNPKRHDYERYGGRGILVCKEWLTFKVFQKWCLESFIPGCSLDRIDNNSGYSPQNCRWATLIEQRKNVRFTEKHAKALQKVRERKFAIYGDPKTRVKKRCRICKIFLSFDNFHKDRYAADKLFGACMSCAKKRRKYVSKTRNSFSQKSDTAT